MTDAFIDLGTATPQETNFTVHGRSITDPCECAPYNGGLPIYDFTGGTIPGTKTDTGPEEFPIHKDISFVRGDQWDGEYLFKGKVWTPARPVDVDGLFLYAEGEVVPDGETASGIVLPAAWERTDWFSQIRSTYGAAIRYYNGWVPWYGSNPGSWWFSHSTVANLVCKSEYSDEFGGTIVKLIVPSNSSYKIYPSQTNYRWSLVRATPSVVDSIELPELPDDEPIKATGWANVHTMLVGKVVVEASWTVIPIDYPDQNLHLGNEPHLDENVYIRPPTPDPNWLPPSPPTEFADQKPVEAKPPEVAP